MKPDVNAAQAAAKADYLAKCKPVPHGATRRAKRKRGEQPPPKKNGATVTEADLWA